MPPWTQFLIIVVLLGIFVIILVQVRIRLLNLWKDVSNKEVVFHRLLHETSLVFMQHKELFDETEWQAIFKKVKRFNKQKIRYLLLQERRDLFSTINSLYRAIEDEEDDKYNVLKTNFQHLQRARRIYNSKVLIYNQTITMFPNRYFAIKLNLKTKEYFG